MNSVAPGRQSQWEWRAAGNFIGGGTGTGLYLFTTFDSLAGVTRPWLSLLGLALIVGGLSLVWLEMGRPWRFINVIFHPQTSWMTREALVAVPLIIFGLAGAWFGWRTLMVVAAGCGIGFLYCQARMLHAAKGIPAWRTPKIVPMMVTTGLCEGAALFLAVGYFLSPASTGITPAAAVYALLVLIIARVWFWLAYRDSLAGGDAPDLTVVTLRRINSWFLGLGHVLPVIILAGSLLLPEQAAILHLLAGLFALTGGWLLKFTIVTRAAYTQGYALLRTPARQVRSGGGPGTKPGWS
jgi:phenylacetyl-CoA:acceptor oxidoreductase subunit 2